MKTELIAVQEQLNSVIKEGERKVEEYAKQVEAANLAAEQANSDYVKAKREINADGYAKASQEKRTAQDIAELYNSKIDEVNSEPFISEQEYERYKKEIKSALEKSNVDAKKRIIPIIEQLEEIKKELKENVILAGNLLKTLQTDCIKQPAGEIYKYIGKDGREYTTIRSEEKVEYRDTIYPKLDDVISELKQ